MVFTHKFWKLQKLLIIKYFSCNPKFGKYAKAKEKQKLPEIKN